MSQSSTLAVPLELMSADESGRRLWIGNLDPRITEFKLVKLLQKYGTIETFDLLFHHSGPLEGQPRGYAFVTYTTPDVAHTVKAALHGKMVGSKNISIKWANKMNKSNWERSKLVPDIPALAGGKQEKTDKNTQSTIQAIEAKLKNMEKASKETDLEITNKPLQLSGPSIFNTTASTTRVRGFINKHKFNSKPYTRKKWK